MNTEEEYKESVRIRAKRERGEKLDKREEVFMAYSIFGDAYPPHRSIPIMMSKN